MRQRLGMDSGYASRLLRSLEAQGLIESAKAAGDRRVRRARLTRQASPSGPSSIGARMALRRRSSNRSTRPAHRARHGDGRRRTAPARPAITIGVEDPASEEARWCIRQYLAELAERFEHGFDPAQSTQVEVEDLTPPAGLLLVARQGGRPVGCGGLRFTGMGAQT